MSEDSDEPRSQDFIFSMDVRSRRSGIPSPLWC